MTTLRKRKADPQPEEEMPVITSMLDLAFQLLAFFILTFDPSTLREGQMEMALPPKDDTAAHQPQDIIPDTKPKKDELPELTTEVDITLTAQPNGFRIQVEEGVVTTPFDSVDALRTHLDTTFKRKYEKIKDAVGSDQAAIAEEVAKIGVTVRASSTLAWGDVISVIDACRLAGFTSITPAKPQDLAGGGDG